MTADETVQAIVAFVRKIVLSPHATVRYTDKTRMRRLLDEYDEAMKRKTGFARVLEDDGDELPGAKDATSLPLCGFCEHQFRPKRKDQRYCRAECRKAAYYDRQNRIRHKPSRIDPHAGE